MRAAKRTTLVASLLTATAVAHVPLRSRLRCVPILQAVPPPATQASPSSKMRDFDKAMALHDSNPDNKTVVPGSAPLPVPPVPAYKAAEIALDHPAAQHLTLTELAHRLVHQVNPQAENYPTLYAPADFKLRDDESLDLSWLAAGQNGQPYLAYGNSRFGDILLYADGQQVKVKLRDPRYPKWGTGLNLEAMPYLIHKLGRIEYERGNQFLIETPGHQLIPTYMRNELRMEVKAGEDPLQKLNLFLEVLLVDLPRDHQLPDLR